MARAEARASGAAVPLAGSGTIRGRTLPPDPREVAGAQGRESVRRAAALACRAAAAESEGEWTHPEYSAPHHAYLREAIGLDGAAVPAAPGEERAATRVSSAALLERIMHPERRAAPSVGAALRGWVGQESPVPPAAATPGRGVLAATPGREDTSPDSHSWVDTPGSGSGLVARASGEGAAEAGRPEALRVEPGGEPAAADTPRERISSLLAECDPSMRALLAPHLNATLRAGGGVYSPTAGPGRRSRRGSAVPQGSLRWLDEQSPQQRARGEDSSSSSSSSVSSASPPASPVLGLKSSAMFAPPLLKSASRRSFKLPEQVSRSELLGSEAEEARRRQQEEVAARVAAQLAVAEKTRREGEGPGGAELRTNRGVEAPPSAVKATVIRAQRPRAEQQGAPEEPAAMAPAAPAGARSPGAAAPAGAAGVRVTAIRAQRLRAEGPAPLFVRSSAPGAGKGLQPADSGAAAAPPLPGPPGHFQSLASRGGPGPPGGVAVSARQGAQCAPDTAHLSLALDGRRAAGARVPGGGRRRASAGDRAGDDDAARQPLSGLRRRSAGGPVAARARRRGRRRDPRRRGAPRPGAPHALADRDPPTPPPPPPVQSGHVSSIPPY